VQVLLGCKNRWAVCVSVVRMENTCGQYVQVLLGCKKMWAVCASVVRM